MPKLLTTPFASEATSEYRTDVQNSTGAEPNSATYEQGFPPVTMEKIADGGKPPKGSDLNGVLYDITDNLVSLTKGARYGFNEAYANAIGGYPLGAVLRLNNGVEVESEVDSNSINPNVDMTGWKLAVSDNGIVTWSGRTQRDENKGFKQSIDNINTRNNFVSVKHYRKSGFIYDVITGIQPYQLELKSNQISSGSPIMTRLTSRQASDKFNRPIVINGSGFKNADGTTGAGNLELVPDGVFIQDGVVISDWGDTSVNRDQACCLMSNGELKRFLRSEATAQQMVEQGAILGVSWGVWYKYNGINTDLSTSTEISARTVIFQKNDNSIGFLLVEGVSNNYGAKYNDVQNILEEIGNVKSAFNLDGGGSTQCYWGNTYAVPSSDDTTRTLANYFTVNVSSVLPYDSGIVQVGQALTGDSLNPLEPALYLRQIGKQVALTAQINNTIASSGLTTITSGGISKRYRPQNAVAVRSINIGGGNGALFTLTQGGGATPNGSISAAPVTINIPPTTTIGSMNWLVEKN